MGFRFSIIILILFLIYGIVIFNFYQLQIVKGGYYLAKASSQLSLSSQYLANRGIIYGTDKNGNYIALAINQNSPIIYANPSQITDATTVANAIASILNKSPQSLINGLSQKNQTYFLISKDPSSDEVSKIANLNFKGIIISYLPTRFYPFNTLASNLLGFVGYASSSPQMIGRYGVEEYYNSLLSGQVIKQSDGEVKILNGQNLNLTIDPNIQFEAETVLKNLVDQYNCPGGEVIITDPQTGKILAMAILPNFNPNNYYNYSIGNFINPAISQIFEPGSIMKVITMAIGIENNKITPTTTYFDTGEVKVNGAVIKNWDLKSHGTMTMTGVIEDSLNTGAVFAENKIGNQLFAEYMKKFGFDKKTGIDLPGEISGDLSRLTLGAPQIYFDTAAFGQGVAVTPMELIEAVSAIANGGKLMRPYVNADLGPKMISQVISPQTASEVTQMMVAAVDNAKIAAINGYSLAGKTGTAQIPKDGAYGESEINNYIGFGPASNPKFLIYVRIDKPKGNPWAADSIVPVFRQLASFLINYYNIPPDRINTN